MEVKILGNQSPFQLNGKKGIGYLVNPSHSDGAKIMLDAGNGSHSNLQVSDYENLKLILSHGHFDHVADVENMLYAVMTLKANGILQPNFSIYLPKEMEQDIENIVLTKGIKAKDVAEIIRYGGSDILKFGLTDIDFMKTNHSADSYATRIRNNGGSMLGYTGDIGQYDIESIADFFKESNAIITECSIPQNLNKPFPQHMKPHDCAKLKHLSNAEKILLTHFYPLEPAQNYLKSCKEKTDNCFVAEEGLIFNV